jgi:hypothetical protein
VAALNTLRPGPPTTSTAVDLGAGGQAHLGLVGYLSGDVDGSLAEPAGAQVLDPAYFSALVAEHNGLNLSQFGVYGG